MEDTHHLLNKVVTFTEMAIDYDLSFEEGMKAKVISVLPVNDSITVVFDFSDFYDYNLTKEVKQYYASEGDPKLWHELETFPKKGIVACSLPNDPEAAPFTLDEESVTSLLKSLKPITYLITVTYEGRTESHNVSYQVKAYPGGQVHKPMIEDNFLVFKKDMIDYFIPVARLIDIQVMPLVETPKSSTKPLGKK
jgi:hypothetical protein